MAKPRSDKFAPSEDSIQAALFQHIALRRCEGVFAYHPANGGQRNPATGRKLKAMGVKPGVPDVALIVRGKPHFIELKAERGYMSPAQKLCRDEIQAAGGEWALCRGLDCALDQLIEWGAIA